MMSKSNRKKLDSSLTTIFLILIKWSYILNWILRLWVGMKSEIVLLSVLPLTESIRVFLTLSFPFVRFDPDFLCGYFSVRDANGQRQLGTNKMFSCNAFPARWSIDWIRRILLTNNTTIVSRSSFEAWQRCWASFTAQEKKLKQMLFKSFNLKDSASPS